jgi:hypothetical protein
MAVLHFDPAKRRRRPASSGGQGPAKIYSLERLSDRVLLRVIQRAGRREMENVLHNYLITKGEPELVPSRDQMEEMEHGFIEF